MSMTVKYDLFLAKRVPLIARESKYFERFFDQKLDSKLMSWQPHFLEIFEVTKKFNRSSPKFD